MTTEHVNAGRSILEILWEEMDRIMDILKGDWERETRLLKKGSEALYQKDPIDMLEFGEVRGQAQSLAYALAVLTNPYAVDTPAIKREALARWENLAD